MGGKNDGADEAKQARADEEARQARIRQGTSRINTIFDGGTTTSGAVSGAYDPTKTYYNADGSIWTPTAAPANPLQGLKDFGNDLRSGGSSGGASGGVSGWGGERGGNAGLGAIGRSITRLLTPEQQFAAAQKNGGLFSNKTTTTGFDDNFYNGRKQAYLDYADPQLESQYGDANKQLTFSLARGGLLDSSVRGDKLGDLQKLYDTQKQAVADKALSYETGARNSVEDARSNLISTLNATGDAEGAAKSALARSSALTQPDAYSPLGQLFTDFTNGLGIQAAQERSYAAGGAKPLYNTGLFSNAGRVAVNQ
ncbi:hypothetical protein LB543_04925 [Mesorhizobium sp. ESP7-2]|uniref:hypothetical protein n=1 Tax=Mesorhizobium sp. ESP7-2 TaxID=2876622 RepID=UPI001CCF60F6|nr:hypothetical protein [Mesorhizobium sp. ESP7-2]MBZ9706062.1 hypothetical protein [Mesorhizobium sp. ESP7-2]